MVKALTNAYHVVAAECWPCAAARKDPDYLRETFPPLQGSRAAMGDVFTSCNWTMRDG